MSNKKIKNTGVIHPLTIVITILMAVMLTAGLLPGLTMKVYADGPVGAHSHKNNNGDVFLGGNYIEVGLDKTGSFGTLGNANGAPEAQKFHPVYGSNTRDGQIGLTVDPDGFDMGEDPIGGDFFMPGSPEERYILSYKTVDGNTINNNNCARRDASWDSPKAGPTTDDQSDINRGFLKAVTTGTTKENVEMASTVSFKEDEMSFDTKVTLTNNGTETIQDVRYCRSFDPDQDYDKQGTYYTYNKVISNPTPDGGNNQWAVVVAKGEKTQASFFFASHDKRARASHGVNFAPQSSYLDGLWDNAEVTPITAPTPEDMEGIEGYTREDNAIAITFNLGNLAPGESVTFSYSSSLDPDAKNTFSKLLASAVDYFSETLEGLEPGHEYEIKIKKPDGTVEKTIEITTGADQTSIPLQVDQEGTSYDMLGKTVEIIDKTDPLAIFDPVEIAPRPDAEDVSSASYGEAGEAASKPADISKDSISTTENSISVSIDTTDSVKMEQQYRLYKSDGTPIGDWVSPDHVTGKIEFSGLDPNTEYKIKAQIPASGSAPRSEVSKGISVSTALPSIVVTASDKTLPYDQMTTICQVDSVEPDDATVTYSYSPDQLYDSAIPFTRPGLYTVYYRATKDYYRTSYGSFNVRVKKGKLTYLNEGFEDPIKETNMPEDWTVSKENRWKEGVGDFLESTGAHSGEKNMKILHVNSGDEIYLITPMLDLRGLSADEKLNFAYINRPWGSDIDEFGVYYRVNEGDWIELFNTTQEHSSWTEESISLPAAVRVDNVQFGFKYKDKYGYGVGLDDVVLGSPQELTETTVYHVMQGTDGKWSAPSDTSDKKATGIYNTPDEAHFTATGYSFGEFKADPSARNAVSDGQDIMIPAGTEKLYVYYSRNKYPLTFYKDVAGHNVYLTENVYYDASLKTYAGVIPTHGENETFAGWSSEMNQTSYADKDGNITAAGIMDWEHTHMSENGVKAYPILVHDRLKVKLEPAGDESTHTPATMGIGFDGKQQKTEFTLDLGEKIRMEGLDSTTRVGYTLDGWYTKGGTKWTADMSFDPEYCDKGADGKPSIAKEETRRYNYYQITLTARWNPVMIPVVYDVNGNTGVRTDTGRYGMGSTVTVAAAPPPIQGQIFTGWKGHSGTLHSPGESFVFNDWNKTEKAGGNDVIKLTAQYIESPQYYKMTFVTDGGTAVEPEPVIANTQISKPEDPTKTGYTFKGWKNGDVDFIFPYNPEDSPADIVLTAKWEKNSYTITFDAAGGSPVPAAITEEYDDEITAPDDPTKEGYTFAGWNPALPKRMPAANMALTATWNVNQYTITFDTDGGSRVEPITENYGAAITPPEAPTRANHTFAGWSTPIPTYMPAHDMTIKAKWKANQQAPSAPAVEPDVRKVEVKDVKTDEEYIILPKGQTPTDEDWATSIKPNNDNEVIFDGLKPNTEYDVYARMQGTEDKNPSPESKPKTTKTLKELQSLTIDPKSPIAGQNMVADVDGAGHVTYQWYRGDELIAGATNATYKPEEGDAGKIFKVVAKQNDIELSAEVLVKNRQAAPSVSKTDETFKNKNDGKITGLSNLMEYRTEEDPDSYQAVEGTTIENLAPGTYYVRMKENDTSYASDAVKVVIKEGPTGIVTFYTTQYNVVSEVELVKYGDKVTRPEKDPTREGYTFVGWFKDLDGTVEWNFENDTITEAKTKIYAKWKEFTSGEIQTEPAAKDLTYNGSSQALVTSGLALHGTIYYRLGGGAWTELVPVGKDAGKYTVSWYMKPDAGYNSSSSAAEPAGSIEVTIKKAELTVTAEDKVTTKGSDAPAFTATYSGFVGDPAETAADLGGELKFTCSYNKGDAEGTYDIVPSGYTSNNYNIKYVKGTLTVGNSGEATATAPKAIDLTYTAADQALVTAGTATHGTIYYRLGSGSWTKDIPTGKEAGKYNVSWYVKPDAGYNSSSSAAEPAGSVEVTIKKAALTVTAEDKAITKGDAAPAYTATYAGFVGDPAETAAVLGGELKFTCNYNKGDAEGTYDIVPSGYTSNNYNIKYVTGKLTVGISGQATAAAPKAKDLTYSAADQVLVTAREAAHGTIYYRLGNGSWTTEIPTGKDAGKYSVSWYVKPDAGYNSSSSAAEPAGSVEVTIKKAALTVTAEDKAITKGDAAPAYTATYAGFVGDPAETAAVLGGELKFTCNYNKGDAEGTYDIVPSGYTSNNYDIKYVKGTLTVGNSGEATATAPKAKDLTYNGDDQALVTAGEAAHGTIYYRLGSGSWTKDIPTGKEAGKYNVSWYVKPDAGYNSSSSAAEPAGSVEVTIKKAALTVTAEDKAITKGDAAPVYTATYAGFVGTPAETAAVLDGELKFTCNYNKGDAEGTYDIVPSGYTSDNYSIKYVTGKLTVGNSGEATATAPKAKDLTYNGDDQALVTAGEAAHGTIYYRLRNGSWTKDIPTGKDAGKYPVSWYVKADTGYSSSSSAAEPAGSVEVTIKKAALTVTAEDKAITKGDAAPVYTATYAGFVGTPAETAAVLDGELKFTCNYNKGDAEGTYDIVPSGYTSDNYNIKYVTGKLTVATSGDATAAAPKAKDLTYNGDDQALVTAGTAEHGTIYYRLGSGSWTKDIPTGKDAGKYSVSWYVKPDAGYDSSSSAAEPAGSVDVTIKKKEVKLVWGETIEWVYDGNDHVPEVTVETGVTGETLTATVTGAASSPGKHTAKVIGLDGPTADNYKLPANVSQEFSIKKSTLEPSVTITGWTYGDKQGTPSVAGNAGGGNVTYYYKPKTAEDTAYSDEKPVNAGEYTIKAVIAATAGYEETSVTTDFVISKRTADLVWENIAFLYDGDTHIPTATVGNLAKGDDVQVLVSGAQTDASAEPYIAEAVELTGADADNYKLPQTTTQPFTISEGIITPAVTITGWTYQGAAQEPVNEPVVEGNEGDGDVTFTYALEGSDEFGSYEDIVNGQAGTYIVKAEIAKVPDKYEESEAFTTFTITPKTVNLEWTGTSLTYNGESQAPSAIAANLVGDDECDVTVDGAQVNAGEYIAEATELSNSNYILPESAKQTFIISKANIEYDSEGYIGVSDNKDHGITVTVKEPADAVVMYGTSKGTYDLDESPVYKEAGVYTVYYEITADNYNTVTGKENVVISAPDKKPEDQDTKPSGKTDQEAADAVTAKINAIKTDADVDAARAAYDALTPAQKALVPAAALNRLKEAEARKNPATQMEKNNLAINSKLKVSQPGSKVKVAWGKVPGATNYKVFATYCGSGKYELIKDVAANGKLQVNFKKLKGKKINLKKNMKIYIAAYNSTGGKTTQIGKTIVAHIVGRKNMKYSNVKKIKLKKKSFKLKVGKKAKIKAKTVLVHKNKKQLTNAHAKEFRYASTNRAIATVSKKGVITAKHSGTCEIYVYARNGYAKKVKVTVR